MTEPHPRKLRALVRTGSGFPDTWDGRLEDGQIVFIHYRHGVLQVGMGATEQEACDHLAPVWVNEEKFNATLDDEDEMLAHAGLILGDRRRGNRRPRKHDRRQQVDRRAFAPDGWSFEEARNTLWRDSRHG